MLFIMLNVIFDTCTELMSQHSIAQASLNVLLQLNDLYVSRSGP